jgi:hypothetical protein
MHGEQMLDGDSVVKAWRIGGHTVLARVSSEGAGTLRCELGSAEALPDDVVAAALDRFGFFFSVDDDLAPFDATAAALRSEVPAGPAGRRREGGYEGDHRGRRRRDGRRTG